MLILFPLPSPENLQWGHDGDDDLSVCHLEFGEGEGARPDEPKNEVLDDAKVIVVLSGEGGTTPHMLHLPLLSIVSPKLNEVAVVY